MRRAAALLRQLREQLRRTPRRLRSLAPRTVKVDVHSSRDVATGASGFRITGPVPALTLSSDLPRGFVRISATVRASRPVWVTLQVFHEEWPRPEVTVLGRATDEWQTFHACCALPDGARAEVRPVPFEGTLAISGITARQVSPLEIARRIEVGEVRNLPRPRQLWDAARERLRRMDLPHTAYEVWRLFNDPDDEALAALRKRMSSLSHRPKISVLVPVYAPDLAVLERCVASVRRQVYGDWELCLADDASPDPAVGEYLMRLSREDPRIRVVLRPENGHISEASNSALSLATGEFVALLDHDDELAPDALFEVARALNDAPDLDVIYSDEDKLDKEGRRFDPRFKPEWSPELLLAQMYLGHLCVYRRSLVEEVGGFRKGYEGSQDHDLALRVTERTQRVRRIPRILYHWRVSATSAAGGQGAKPYAINAARIALEDALRRRSQEGRVEALAGFPGHYVVHLAADPACKVSILIPIRDGASCLERCLSSLVEKTRHPSWEVCVVDNASREPATLELFARWTARLGRERFRVIPCPGPFHFSRLVNAGATATDGPLLLLLDSDTEIVDGGWLEELAGYARQPDLGAVGCRLLYEDGSLHHGGLVLDEEAVAVHAEQGLRKGQGGYFGRFVSTANFSAVTRSCLMVRRDAFQAAGGFDEAPSVGYEEVDFCLRLSERGLRNLVLGQVRLSRRRRGPGPGASDDGGTPGRETQAEFMRERWRDALRADPFHNPNLTAIGPFLRACRTSDWVWRISPPGDPDAQSATSSRQEISNWPGTLMGSKRTP